MTLLHLLLVAIVAAVLGLIGVMLAWRDTAVIDRLRPNELATLKNKMLLDGYKLCENCSRRWTRDALCEMCVRVRELEAQLREPAPKFPAPSSFDGRTRSRLGYTPLYASEGFHDLYSEPDED